MDEIVKQAMSKWPNVPHCYGWLGLDARGVWRMRDERAQSLNLPGDKIAHSALLGFINRNYTHDLQGRWYFQNGPQRVYVDLEATPYIARTDPTHEFILHNDEPMQAIDAVWMTETGQLLLKSGDKIAAVDDRDMALCMAQLRLNGAVISDERLLAWLQNQSGASDKLSILLRQAELPVTRIESGSLAAHFGFTRHPQTDPLRENAPVAT